MTKDEFLQRPLAHLFSQTQLLPPPDWVQEAWDDEAFRQEAIFAFSRSVSKVGSLRIASDWLGLLTTALSASQAAELYKAIRDSTERSESEWRNEFESSFSSSVPLLPPVDRGRELINHTLAIFIAMYWNELDKVRDRIQALVDAGFQLDDANMTVSEFAKFAEGEECLIVLGPLGPSDQISPLSLATSLKQDQLVKLLRSYGATR